jgi:predicted RNase H-like nuclease (RuvC/YqgF family)
LAVHEENIRAHMKAIRSREESLDEMRRRRRNLGSQADTADKKLSKMGSEHKNLVAQTDQLNRLREDIRALDSEIMTEEAQISDFKRQATREWMSLKFGGLSELSGKGLVSVVPRAYHPRLTKRVDLRRLWQGYRPGEIWLFTPPNFA